MPSALDRLYWKTSLADLRFKVSQKFAEHQVNHLQEYQILAKILSAAFGGDKNNTSAQQPKADVVYQPTSVKEAEWMLRKVLGG